MDNFRQISILGIGNPCPLTQTGGQGEVWLMQYKETGQLFAVKILSKEKLIKEQQEDHIAYEKKIWEKLDSPFIVKLRESFAD